MDFTVLKRPAPILMFASLLVAAGILIYKLNFSADSHLEQGLEELNRNKPELALEHFNTAIEKDADFPQAFVNRGVAHYQLGDTAEAMADWGKAIELNKNQRRAYFNRGLAYHNQGKFHRALDDFNRTISINRSDEDAWFHRGLAHLELDEREPACTAFRQADQFGHDEAAGMLQRHCPNHNAEPDPQPR